MSEQRDLNQRDYRDTVFLPKTDFPMKAGLPQKEPGIQARWESEGLYRQLRAARAGREKFILHDGPPYANGDMHIGHALNHVLKDMVCRTHNLLGKDAPYVPGWDCHGLPIEWKVEEQYRKKKLDKNQVPAKEFRAECRAYAQHWVDVQREQLKRLGIMGDWDNPYLTMDFQAEATIVAELMKFAEAGNLYRGSKPVMWSPVEETALAEAEVEYEDIVSTQVDVAFEIVESPIPELIGAYAVIWTTTPWTIPVNQAIAYGENNRYVQVRFGIAGQTPHLGPDLLATNFLAGRSFLVATDLLPDLTRRIEAYLNSQVEAQFPGHSVSLVAQHAQTQSTNFSYNDSALTYAGSELAGTFARHPMAGRLSPLPSGEGPGEGGAKPAGEATPLPNPSPQGEGLASFFDRPRPFLPGDFVTTDSGTGLVHMAPDHGEDDFELCRAHGIEPVFAVNDDGKYRDDWAWLGGQGPVVPYSPKGLDKLNIPEGPICSDLRDAGALLSAAPYQHSYPHSWRSKAKVIFRCTPQWFVPMDRPLGVGDFDVAPGNPLGGAVAPFVSHDHSTLRQRAMQAIADTRFVPEKGRNRIGAMVEGRPDWVLSRQRAWGVPITLFVRNGTGDYLQDPAVNARVVAAVLQEGVDAWGDALENRARKAEFLGPDYNPQDYEMVTDILDVWFDSGSTHAFVLESGRWPDLQWPADLYLEGSDQHRGWFQSSLLESCATRGRAPFNAILTHGFTMDSQGKKMSKSLGNTIDPLKVMETYGADIIRLWALSVDFTEDHRIGDEILKGVADQYRKLRNTMRYLLGALDGYDHESEHVVFDAMPELERYMLDRLVALDTTMRRAVADFDYNEYTRALIDFCNEDLSAFFFDIRKDRLYCDDPAGTERRAYRTVLDILFQALVRYAAPVLVFTAEEVWTTRFPERGSVHLLEMHPLPVEWTDEELAARFHSIRTVRDQVTEAIEPLRRDKTIRSSLEAEVEIGSLTAVPPGFNPESMSELFIVAKVTKVPGHFTVRVSRTSQAKCGRCWRLLPSVPEDGALCHRCGPVVAGMDAVA
ncbi:MAG: isoleucine--tRNA ligase [Erythrobacter sp.]|jgi:isoleucyl-tRNA synthetase